MAAGDQTRTETEPTAETVTARLESDILFGRLRPRERLVEDEQMQRLGAKRHAVRVAFAELERMGIVVRVPNRGAFVRDFTAREVEEIAEIREVLQRRAAERISLPPPDGLVDRLTALQRGHDAAVARADPRLIDSANEAFHAAFFEACGSRHLADAIAHYAYLSRAMRLYPMIDPVLLETLRAEHWAMIEALRDGDRAALRRLVCQHIQHSKRIYLEARRAPDAD